MRLKVKIIPRFDAREIMNTTLKRDWLEFQLHALDTGKALHKHMIGFISANHKRSGGTGKLAKAINFDIFSTTGKIHWGIGHIPTLNQKVKGYGGKPYWYVVNYGRKINGQPFIPGGGKYRPVMFDDGPADPAKRGTGKSKARIFKKITGNAPRPSVIRPMHFVENSYSLFLKHIQILLARFKRR